MGILTAHLRLKMKLNKAIPAITQECQHPFNINRNFVHLIITLN